MYIIHSQYPNLKSSFSNDNEKNIYGNEVERILMVPIKISEKFGFEKMKL